jgi:CcmD family protein
LRATALLAAFLVATLPFGAPASAQSGGSELVSGFVVGVETDGSDRLTRLAVSDSSGSVHEFTVNDSTEFGLENEAGDRWVSTFAASPVESVSRLRDHQQRLATVTVTSADGVASSVVERDSGKLGTNLGYLFAVFAVTWAAFFAYMFWVSRKQRDLQRDLARLRATLERASGRD